MVEPVDPLEGCELYRLDAPPRAAAARDGSPKLSGPSASPASSGGRSRPSRGQFQKTLFARLLVQDASLILLPGTAV